MDSGKKTLAKVNNIAKVNDKHNKMKMSQFHIKLHPLQQRKKNFII